MMLIEVAAIKRIIEKLLRQIPDEYQPPSSVIDQTVAEIVRVTEETHTIIHCDFE